MAQSESREFSSIRPPRGGRSRLGQRGVKCKRVCCKELYIPGAGSYMHIECDYSEATMTIALLPWTVQAGFKYVSKPQVASELELSRPS